MNGRVVWMALAAAVAWSGRLESQVPARAGFDSAAYAWEAGRYIEALERLERLLTGPGRDTLLAPIALLTGELYRTREIAPDATSPRWSANGTMLAYEIGSDTSRRSVLVNLNDAGPLRPDTLPGYAATFAPDGSEIAYLSASGSAAVLRPTAGGSERTVEAPGLASLALVYGADNGPPYLVAAADPSAQMAELYELGSGDPRPLAGGGRVTGVPLRAAGGRLVFPSAELGVTIRAPNGSTTVHRGIAPSVSADGGSFTFLRREGADWTILHARIGAEPRVLVRSARPLAAPAISQDGSLVTYQSMPREDWELYAVSADGGSRAGSPTRSSTTSPLSSSARVGCWPSWARDATGAAISTTPRPAREPACFTTTPCARSPRNTSGWRVPTGTSWPS
jgi:hypothetical protein